MSNVYMRPEEIGLEELGEIEFSEPCWSFDFAVVWYRPETKEFYYAADSGCSCPSPFEDYHSLSDLNGPYSSAGIIDVIDGFSGNNQTIIDKAAVIAAVKGRK